MKAEIELKKTDLYQYGEKYEVCIKLENGFEFSAKIQEHEYDRIKLKFGNRKLFGQFEQDEIYS